MNRYYGNTVAGYKTDITGSKKIQGGTVVNTAMRNVF
jgi:hypothetical protein